MASSVTGTAGDAPNPRSRRTRRASVPLLPVAWLALSRAPRPMRPTIIPVHTARPDFASASVSELSGRRAQFT